MVETGLSIGSAEHRKHPPKHGHLGHGVDFIIHGDFVFNPGTGIKSHALSAADVVVCKLRQNLNAVTSRPNVSSKSLEV